MKCYRVVLWATFHQIPFIDPVGGECLPYTPIVQTSKKILILRLCLKDFIQVVILKIEYCFSWR